MHKYDGLTDNSVDFYTKHLLLRQWNCSRRTDQRSVKKICCKLILDIQSTNHLPLILHPDNKGHCYQQRRGLTRAVSLDHLDYHKLKGVLDYPPPLLQAGPYPFLRLHLPTPAFAYPSCLCADSAPPSHTRHLGLLPQFYI